MKGEPNLQPDRIEEDDGFVYCPACGWDIDWEDCDQCRGDGFFDWETLQFEDPFWYQPGDTEICEQCNGKGGWHICVNRECKRGVVEIEHG